MLEDDVSEYCQIVSNETMYESTAINKIRMCKLHASLEFRKQHAIFKLLEDDVSE